MITQSRIDSVLLAWTDKVNRLSLWIILLIPLAAASVLFYTIENLGMNTDVGDMLSAELPWRQLDIEYERLFPHETDNLVIVIEAETADEAIDSALILEKKLREQPEFFKTVFYSRSQDFIQESALLYLDEDELLNLSDNLAINQPFLARLIEDQSIHGLMHLLIDAIEALNDGEKVELEKFLREINKAISAHLDNAHYQMSWQHLLMPNNDSKKEIYREIIIVQPILDYSNLLPAEHILPMVRQMGIESGIHDNNNMRLRLTGGVALSHEELESVSKANINAIIIAFTLVALLLIFGLGSVRLVIAILITLLIGLIFTAGFATLAIGELNLISVAFAVLYIGLGVDFAIHYCLRYRELCLRGHRKNEALANTSVHIGSSLVLCAFTTAIGFYAFVPTDYDGVAELGLISGTGMFISLLVTLTFLPALLKYLNIQFNSNKANINVGFYKFIHSFPERFSTAIIFSVVILTGLSFYFVQNIQFDNNTLNLQPPENESVKTYKDLLMDSDAKPLTNVVLSKDESDAYAIEEKLKQLSLVEDVVWLESFIPTEQEEKLFIIDEMNLLLGDLFSQEKKKHSNLEQGISSIQKLHTILKEIPNDKWPGVTQLRDQLGQLLMQIESLPQNEQIKRMQELEQSLLASLPGRLALLDQSLATEGLTLDDINPDFIKRWKSEDRYLIKIIPVENLQDNQKLHDFVEQTQATIPNVTGSPVVSIEAGKAVVNAFIQAFLSAIAVILLLLLLLMPKKADSLFVLGPLLFAALLTASMSSLLNIQINFANIIALPLLLGIGVDSAIHIIYRYHKKEKNELLLATSSARGIMISALTTILSIGNLAFSPHVGTASMGKLLALGISIALLCAIILIPSLLAKRQMAHSYE